MQNAAAILRLPAGQTMYGLVPGFPSDFWPSCSLSAFFFFFLFFPATLPATCRLSGAAFFLVSAFTVDISQCAPRLQEMEWSHSEVPIRSTGTGNSNGCTELAACSQLTWIQIRPFRARNATSRRPTREPRNTPMARKDRAAPSLLSCSPRTLSASGKTRTSKLATLKEES